MTNEQILEWLHNNYEFKETIFKFDFKSRYRKQIIVFNNISIGRFTNIKLR